MRADDSEGACAGARMARLLYCLMENFGGDETPAFFQNVSIRNNTPS